MLRRGSLLVWLLMPTTVFAQSAPVIAVFPIEDSSGSLSPKSLAKITDYFSVKLAETGRFRVVPRKELEAELAAKKADSYKACYDQSCQIEIGRELAAEKVVHTQIVELAGQCAVTATLYDLRAAATEKAASQKAACTEVALVGALEAIAAALGQAPAGVAATPAPAPAAPATSTPAAVAAPTFTLRVSVTPDDAELLLDGKVIGSGRAEVPLAPGSAHTLGVERAGYVSQSHAVRLERDERRELVMEMTAAHREQRTEWLGGSLAVGTLGSGAIALGVDLRAPTVPLAGGLLWTLLTLHLGLEFGKKTEIRAGSVTDCSEVRPPQVCSQGADTGLVLALMTEPVYRFVLGSGHTIQVGLGGGAYFVGVTNRGDDNFYGPALMPSLQYAHATDGGLGWGLGVRAFLPLAAGCSLEDGANDVISCRAGNPLLLQIEVPLGFVD